MLRMFGMVAAVKVGNNSAHLFLLGQTYIVFAGAQGATEKKRSGQSLVATLCQFILVRIWCDAVTAQEFRAVP